MVSLIHFSSRGQYDGARKYSSSSLSQTEKEICKADEVDICEVLKQMQVVTVESGILHQGRRSMMDILRMCLAHLNDRLWRSFKH